MQHNAPVCAQVISGGRTSSDSFASYRTPLHADFLLAHSTVAGYYRWRKTFKELTWISDAQLEEHCQWVLVHTGERKKSGIILAVVSIHGLVPCPQLRTQEYIGKYLASNWNRFWAGRWWQTVKVMICSQFWPRLFFWYQCVLMMIFVLLYICAFVNFCSCSYATDVLMSLFMLGGKSGCTRVWIKLKQVEPPLLSDFICDHYQHLAHLVIWSQLFLKWLYLNHYQHLSICSGRSSTIKSKPPSSIPRWPTGIDNTNAIFSVQLVGSDRRSLRCTTIL